tara:strand:+ start:5063 stop:5344 length:282 start_codon:yes stop_codon:yes gene_type:complete
MIERRECPHCDFKIGLFDSLFFTDITPAKKADDMLDRHLFKKHRVARDGTCSQYKSRKGIVKCGLIAFHEGRHIGSTSGGRRTTWINSAKTTG